MSNIIKQITLSRSYSDGSWNSLYILVEIFNGELRIFDSDNESDRNEDEALTHLLHNFTRDFNSENLRRKIFQEFLNLRETDSSGYSYTTDVAPPDQPKSHLSCKKTSNEDSTKQATEENKISHYE